MVANNHIMYFLREAKFRGKNGGGSYYAQALALRTIDTDPTSSRLAVPRYFIRAESPNQD
jgi:hypothetical protein